jgi:hypothetical protein
MRILPPLALEEAITLCQAEWHSQAIERARERQGYEAWWVSAHERNVQSRWAGSVILPRNEGGLETGPRGGIVIPTVFGLLELHPVVVSVESDHDQHHNQLKVRLYSRRGYCYQFEIQDEVFLTCLDGAEVLRRQVSKATHRLAQAEHSEVDSLTGMPTPSRAMRTGTGARVLLSDGSCEIELDHVCSSSTLSWQASVTDWLSDGQAVDEEAEKRSRDVLLACLSPEQMKQFDRFDRFEVVAYSGNRYHILPKKDYNVRLLDEAGNETAALCAGPDDHPPICDQMLAQKLWLEADEEGFLKVANKSSIGNFPSSSVSACENSVEFVESHDGSVDRIIRDIIRHVEERLGR